MCTLNVVVFGEKCHGKVMNGEAPQRPRHRFLIVCSYGIVFVLPVAMKGVMDRVVHPRSIFQIQRLKRSEDEQAHLTPARK